MKKFLVLLALLCLTVSSSFSQKLEEKPNFFGIGPMVSFGAGVNAADVPEGTKNGVAYALGDIGITGTYIFNPKSNVGVVLDLKYSQFPFRLVQDGNEDIYQINTLSYISIAPKLYLSGFTLGFSVNLSPDLSSEDQDGNEFEDSQLFEDDMVTTFGVNIGGQFALYENDFGRLNLFLDGTYFITPVLDEGYSAGFNLDEYNFNPASLKLGLSYLFNVNNF